MKQLTQFFLLLLLFPISIYSQEKMQEGYFIDNEGIKVEGYIQYQSIMQLCNQVLFAANKTSKTKLYSSKDIKEFYIKNLNRKFKVISFPKYKIESVVNSISDTVFVEILVETKNISLYYHKTKNESKRFFIETATLGLKELISETISDTTGASIYKHVNKKYVGLLKLAFKDCTTIDSKYLEQLRLEIVSVSQAFIKYCECTQEEILHLSSTCEDKGDIHLVLGVGVSYATSSFALPPNGIIANRIPQPIGLAGVPVSLSLYYFPPFLRNTFFMGLSSFYSRKGSYSEITQVRFNQHYLNASFFVGYQYPFGKIKPYWGVEFTIGFLLNKNDAFISTAANNYGKSLLYDPQKYDGEGTEVGIGLFLGTDISISKHSVRVEIKYHYGSLPSLLASYRQHAIQFQIQFKLYIPKAKRKN